MTEPETKRMKVRELSIEASRFLVEWLIRDWKEYNAPDASGTRKEQGTTKQQYWNKWSKHLESIGELRTPEQVKKKINGELAIVRKRIMEERIDAFVSGGEKILPKLSESRQKLYEFLSVNDALTLFEGLESLAPTEFSIESSEITEFETLDIKLDNNGKDLVNNPGTSVGESSEILVPIDASYPKSPSSPVRTSVPNAKTMNSDLSELRRDLLKTELETAQLKRILVQQQYENSLKEAEKLDLAIENERMKKRLLERKLTEI